MPDQRYAGPGWDYDPSPPDWARHPTPHQPIVTVQPDDTTWDPPLAGGPPALVDHETTVQHERELAVERAARLAVTRARRHERLGIDDGRPSIDTRPTTPPS